MSPPTTPTNDTITSSTQHTLSAHPHSQAHNNSIIAGVNNPPQSHHSTANLTKWTSASLTNGSPSILGPPPPKLGFIPRNLFAKNSPNSYQNASLDYTAASGDTPSQDYEVGVESLPYPPHTSPLHNYRSGPATHSHCDEATACTLPHQTAQFHTPLRQSKLDNSTHTTGSMVTSTSAPNAFRMQHIATSRTNSTEQSTKEQSDHYGLSPLSSNPYPATNSPLRTHSWTTEAEKDKKRSSNSQCSTIHYDHRSETLSGGVFDEGALSAGSEFDQLRSEPSLLA